ncbi:hypothetical protein XELAEV_18033762mg [Xenopus laevis]|uniref:Uncharacterized protein n=1 Tax=Xenopus laevis TaxID=8355 RepID=A0A974CJT9_XENLA|nr:hypothetical protein XELAEV_18033762mg [Xenopus laevis]
MLDDWCHLNLCWTKDISLAFTLVISARTTVGCCGTLVVAEKQCRFFFLNGCVEMMYVHMCFILRVLTHMRV